MLPVDLVLPEVLAALATSGTAILEAPPGAGKTTRVPIALLDQPWCRGQRIILLEPRRLAARSAARQMARILGEPLGETVGVRVRGESIVGPRTRLEVVTEGILTRMLQEDPSLPGVAAVIFDEFHERSLHADVGLSLVLGVTRVLRDDLRLLVMSATLDGERLSILLSHAPRIQSDGRTFPVAVQHDSPLPQQPMLGHVAAVIRDVIAHREGSVLVFLPGAKEIHRLGDLLRETLPPDVDLRPLYGALSARDQDAAIAPAPPPRRKIVLATNVAETSLTIDGIATVVDSGYERVSRFNPRTGMSRLDTVRITRASAEQRAGRAGRTAPGTAIRCWSLAESAGLLPHSRAAILDADLAPLALDLVVAGFPDPADLPWMDPPPTSHYHAALLLLHELGAIDTAQRLTETGRAMTQWGVHPRLALMLTRAHAIGQNTFRRATYVAALLEERDLFAHNGPLPSVDMQHRLDLLERSDDSSTMRHGAIHHATLTTVRQQAARLAPRANPISVRDDSAASLGALAAWAWPDRVARRRDAPGRFLMRSGRGTRIDLTDTLAHAEWIVAIEVDDAGREGLARRAVILDSDDAASIIENDATTETVCAWDAESRAVTLRRVVRLGAIIVREDPIDRADPALVAATLLEGIRTLGIAALPWSEDALRLRARITFLHHHDPSWPDLSDEALEHNLSDWLLPVLTGQRRLDELRKLDWQELLLRQLTWQQRAELDALAPERIEVPSGTRVMLDYSDPAAPVLAVRLQEVFGMRESPRLLQGRVPVVMHLLSPARRPVQVTRDLASFWSTGYFDVRRDLRGRYPRHHWPEDPLTAKAEAGVKRRR